MKHIILIVGLVLANLTGIIGAEYGVPLPVVLVLWACGVVLGIGVVVSVFKVSID